MIDVCLCTHNPRPDVLKKVLESIKNQCVGKDIFNLLIIDNASVPPLDESLITPFSKNGIPARMVREVTSGIARARFRAIQETKSEWLLFVDDDNELAHNYITEGLKFVLEHGDVGCFGGKLLLAPGLRHPCWVKPFLSYLAIKDIGDELIKGKSELWGAWEPPTAGAFIKRPVLELFSQRAENDPTIFKLGRRGKTNLSSCEDSLITRSAFFLGLSNAYNPKMVLYHHLDPKRFQFNYLIRLMHAYGVSHVILERLLTGNQEIPDKFQTLFKFVIFLLKAVLGGAKQSLAFGVGIAAYHLGARFEYFRQLSNQQ